MPAHYRAFHRLFLRFAIVMVLAGLLAGIAFQESAKRTPSSALLELALVHGHAFLLGVVIPLSLTWMLHLGTAMGWPPVGARTLRIGAWLYLPGAAMAVLLMFYKGWHVAAALRDGETDLAAIDAAHVLGHHARKAVYGLTHASLAIGLSVIAIGVWRASQANDRAHPASEA